MASNKGPGGPVPANLPPSKSKNKSSRREWHQGFLWREVDGRNRAAFVNESTAQRIAAQAEQVTEIKMEVWPEGDLWCYGPKTRSRS